MGVRVRKQANQIVLLLWIAIISTISSLKITAVNTKLGKIAGLSQTHSIKGSSFNYKEFRAIPYAKPPIGDLRFEEPVQYGSWKGILDAKSFSASCPQMQFPPEDVPLPNYHQSEDCLYLNVYAPASASQSNKKAVMIWIHGGGYILGQGTSYDGSYLSVIGDVIVVTINYRLGIFGFLSTADETIPGNYGLWDQKLAIRWVKNNIDSFGGDPNSITIFGESAGAFSVMLQSVHIGNKGNFHRVISQSGTADSILALAPLISARKNAKYVAAALDCDISLSKETLRCLKSKSSQDIMEYFLNSTVIGGLPKFTFNFQSLDIQTQLVYAPVIDGKFLNDTPSNIINNRHSSAFDLYKSLDVIIGNDEAEGSLLLQMVEVMKNHTSFTTKDGISSNFLCNHIINPYVKDYFGDNPSLAMTICNRYSSTGSLFEQGTQAVNFYGDVVMYTSAVQNLNAHAVRNSNTRQFQFLNKRRSVVSPNSEAYPWFNSAGHGAELPYLFPSESIRGSFSNDDIEFAKRLMQYWSNFAKTGDVNGPGLPRWPEYDLKTKQYVLLDDNITVLNNLYQDRVDFWLTQMFIFNQGISKDVFG